MKLKILHPHELDATATEHEDYDTNHVYLIGGKSHLDLGYKSVTTFIKQFFEDFNPDETLDKYYDGWQKKKHPEYFGVSREDIKKMWEDKGKLASEEGTHMHRQFELKYNDEPYEEVDEMQNFIKWTAENGITPFRTEMTIYSPKYKIVGNVDLIALNDHGEMIIVDYKRSDVAKTSAFGKKCKMNLGLPHTDETKHMLQLNIYKKILEDEYGFKIAGLYNLYIKEDKYKYVKRLKLAKIEDIITKVDS